MKKLEPLVFFGTEDFSADIFQSLIDAGFEIEAAITKPDRLAGRGRKLKPTAVKQLAIRHQIPVFEVTSGTDIQQAVAKTSQTTGILAIFGKIIPEETITSFANGIINVHPSLLPKYRGPSPIISPILAGDTVTGVSIMSLINEIDAGPVYSQSEISLTGQENILDLNRKLAILSGKLLVKTLRDIKNGLKPQPQDHDQATYCRMIKKTDGIIDPTKITAVQAERQVRAFLIWPKSRTKIGNFNLIVLEASASDEIASPLHLICADQSILNIHSVIAPSGKTMSAEDFSRGYQID